MKKILLAITLLATGTEAGQPEAPIRKSAPMEVAFMRNSAKGSRFAIIADRSSSMSAKIEVLDPVKKAKVKRRAIEHVRDEVLKTLESFKPGSHYYIAFFAANPLPMPGDATWVEGGKTPEKVVEWIKKVDPGTSTIPVPAFKKVLKLNPPPDVIFFLSDGQWKNKDAVKEIAEMNKGKIPIHTIHFIDPSAKDQKVTAGKRMETIAQESGGRFTTFGK